ncbi:hypothetical protein P4O66_005132, partial [Electrophorus voltai]
MENLNKIESIFIILVICVVVTRGSITTTHSTPTPPKPCAAQTSCETCLTNVSCLWCQTNATCMDYPVSYVIPPSSVCKLSKARWGVCWVNFEALIIAMAVVGGVVLLVVTVCCCWCCYRCGRSRRLSRQDLYEEEYTRKREQIRQRSDERKAERKTRHDEIRKKYGLIPDSD